MFEVTWWSYVVATHPRDLAGLFGPLAVVVLCLSSRPDVLFDDFDPFVRGKFSCFCLWIATDTATVTPKHPQAPPGFHWAWGGAGW